MYPEELDAAAHQHAQQFIPDETSRGYDSGRTAWETFCAATQLPYDQPRYGALAAFVHYRWQEGRAPNTIRTNLTGIAVRLREEGITVRREDIKAAKDLVKKYARQAADRREPERGRGRVAALSVKMLRQTIRSLDLTTAAGLRDRLVFALGFHIAARSVELAGLSVGDITVVDEGLIVEVRVSKGEGRTVRVAYGADPLTCSVRAWQDWCRFVGPQNPDDAVIRRVHASGSVQPEGMAARGVRDLVLRATSACGWPVRIRSHSLRAGFATAARAAGKDTKAIMDVTGHRSDQVLVYFRDPDGWRPENNATMGIGT
jgi:integrase